MSVGIDKINFFTPNAYVDLKELAQKRGIDPNKFIIGIGQSQMAVQPKTQDTYTMAANAALPMLTKEELATIDLIIFGTESGHDASKSGAVIMQGMLEVQPYCRTFEAKQACYGGTCGVMTACDYVRQHPDRKALVFASDIARYGLNTSGEVTQGAGAIAMLITSNPSIVEITGQTVPYAQDIYDFWRPNYSDTAFVDGKFSNETYINFFNKTFSEFNQRFSTSLEDFKALCFHTPYTKMGLKALRTVLDQVEEEKQQALLAHYEKSILYSRYVGNLYTGSLYLSLLSLLSLDDTIQENDILGLFSYGSGASGEFFTAKVVPGFKEHLPIKAMEHIFTHRQKLTVDEYETIFNQQWLTKEGKETYRCDFDDAPIQLDYIENHRRYYRKS